MRITHPSPAPVLHLTCHVCGGATIGRQWWNRDHGYGTCRACAEWLIARGEDVEALAGIAGEHWGLEGTPAAEAVL